MSTFPAELIARYGIIAAGEKPSEVRHYVPEINAMLTQAKDFVDNWVNERVDSALRRGPIVHVFAVTHAPALLLADTAGGWLDYGHFSVLGTDEGFKACWEEYKKTVKGYKRLSKVKFASYFKPRPFANATLVVTSDNKMLFVRRSATMHLHPKYFHCSGGKVKFVQLDQKIDPLEDARQRVYIETAIPLDKLEQPTYLGLCGNDPYDEVIVLCFVKTTLTAAEVTAVYGKAQESDGGVEWFDYDLPTIGKLLRRPKITPSFRALLFLLRRQITAENRKKK